MSYVLRALIASEKTLQPITHRYATAKLVALRQGIGIIPLTHDLYAEIHAEEQGEDRVLPESFQSLTSNIALLAQGASTAGSIGYIEAEFFGGVGSQAAALWRDGQIVYGPTVTGSEPDMPLLPMSEWAFNSVLRLLGVSAADGIDEFATVGLGSHRDTGAW